MNAYLFTKHVSIHILYRRFQTVSEQPDFIKSREGDVGDMHEISHIIHTALFQLVYMHAGLPIHVHATHQTCWAKLSTSTHASMHIHACIQFTKVSKVLM
jgi:hypothetical protein